MDVLWREGDRPARQIADRLENEVGWNVNTTYTLIKRCIGKGAIARTDPGFQCQKGSLGQPVQRQRAQHDHCQD